MARKQAYNQALSEEEIKEIPNIIKNSNDAYIDLNNGNFFMIFNDKENLEKVNFIHFNVDEIGNYIITTRKVRKEHLKNKNYKHIGQGIEPNISES